MSEALDKLGDIRHSSRKTVARKVKALEISTEHFKNDPYAINRPYFKYSLENILVENSVFKSSAKLRIRLLKEGLLKPVCWGCDKTVHTTKVIENGVDTPIPFQLDHVNGNPTDNRLENLRLLCGTCHTITPTYGRSDAKNPKRAPENMSVCARCRKPCDKNAATCRDCYFVVSGERQTRRTWPSDEELYQSVLKVGVGITAKNEQCRRSQIIRRLHIRGYDMKPYLTT